MRIIGALIVATMFGGAPSKAEPPQPVSPSGVSPKYANEPDEPARMHTCLDQYNVNKPNNANGGLNWIERGGGYYSECNQRLRAAGAQQQISPAPKIAPPNTASNKVFSTGTGFFVSENGHTSSPMRTSLTDARSCAPHVEDRCGRFPRTTSPTSHFILRPRNQTLLHALPVAAVRGPESQSLRSAFL